MTSDKPSTIAPVVWMYPFIVQLGDRPARAGTMLEKLQAVCNGKVSWDISFAERFDSVTDGDGITHNTIPLYPPSALEAARREGKDALRIARDALNELSIGLGGDDEPSATKEAICEWGSEICRDALSRIRAKAGE